MAESVDTYSDIEDDSSESDSLTELFNRAANHVKTLVANLDTNILLELYSYYKQGIEGKCNVPKPRFYELQAKSKWEAWNNLDDMPKDEAKQRYIKLVTSLDPNFENDDCENQNSNSNSWAAVSSFVNEDKQLLDSEKTIFDHVKECDLDSLRLKLKNNFELLNEFDENGMTLVHWAADRGNIDILKHLLTLKVDVNVKDSEGQTPLHYAASCDHFDCVKLLIEKGADISIQDNDGTLPKDLCANDMILQLLHK